MIMQDYKLELETAEREGKYQGIKEVLRSLRHDIKEQDLDSKEEFLKLIESYLEDYFGT